MGLRARLTPRGPVGHALAVLLVGWPIRLWAGAHDLFWRAVAEAALLAHRAWRWCWAAAFAAANNLCVSVNHAAARAALWCMTRGPARVGDFENRRFTPVFRFIERRLCDFDWCKERKR